MFRLYEVLVGIIFTFAIGHMAYTFFYVDLRSAESQLWFFAAGLTMLFNGFINLLHLRTLIRPVKNFAVITNIVFLGFISVLSVVVSEPQVFILFVVLVITLLVSILLPSWNSRVNE